MKINNRACLVEAKRRQVPVSSFSQTTQNAKIKVVKFL